MKKLLLPFFLFILVGCAASKPIECNCPEIKEDKVDIFKKNQECYKYKKGLNEEFDNFAIDRVFYSPSLDTCLFARFDDFYPCASMTLIDVFSRNDVDYLLMENDCELVDAGKFYREIDELIEKYSKANLYKDKQ